MEDGVTMLCLTLKIYYIIIQQKLKTILNKTSEEAQSGFRMNHSGQDHILMMKQVTHKILEEQHLIKYRDIESSRKENDKCN